MLNHNFLDKSYMKLTTPEHLLELPINFVQISFWLRCLTEWFSNVILECDFCALALQRPRKSIRAAENGELFVTRYLSKEWLVFIEVTANRTACHFRAQ